MSQNPPEKAPKTPKRSKVTFNKRLAAVHRNKKDFCDLDLLTIKELKNTLRSSDSGTLNSIKAAIHKGANGLIARNRLTGNYDVLSDHDLAELQKTKLSGVADILGQQFVADIDENSESELLSTQVFKKLVGSDE